MPECENILDCCAGSEFTYQIVPNSQLLLTVLSDPSDGGEVTGGGLYDPGTIVTVTATPEIPTSIDVGVDFVFVVDESGSLADAATILANVTSGLEAMLLEAGVGSATAANRYACVAFGHGDPAETEIEFTDGTTFAAAAAGIGLSGGALEEDAYEGIDYAINSLSWRESSAVARIIFFITDEDRNVHLYTNGADQDAQFATIKSQLVDGGYIVLAMASEKESGIRDINGAVILAADSTGKSYLADGSGGFTQSMGATPTGTFWNGETPAFPTTQFEEYFQLVLDPAVEGYYVSIQQYRSGGLTADSVNALIVPLMSNRITQELLWQFIGWYNSGGELVSSNTTYSFPMNAPQTLTARFTH